MPLWSMLKRRLEAVLSIYLTPVHRVPSCFLSFAVMCTLLKDSIFSSQSHISQRCVCFSRNLHMPIVEWWADCLRGLLLWATRGWEGKLWLTVGQGYCGTQVLGSTHKSCAENHHLTPRPGPTSPVFLFGFCIQHCEIPPMGIVTEWSGM